MSFVCHNECHLAGDTTLWRLIKKSSAMVFISFFHLQFVRWVGCCSFFTLLRRLHRSSHLATYNKSLLFQLFHLRVHTNHHVNGLQFLSWIQCWLKHRSLSSVTRSLPFHFIYPCCNSGPYLLDWARRLQYAVRILVLLEWNSTLIKALKLATYNNKPTILVSRD